MSQKMIALVLGAVAIAWYYICLFQIGLGKAPTNTFGQFMSLSITSIGAALATFVGGLLGVRQIAGAVETTAPLPAQMAQMPVQGSPAPDTLQQQPASIQQQQRLMQKFATTGMQWAATLLYIISLILALWFWYRNDTVDSSITNLGKTLLGLMGGALAIVLNNPKEE